MWHIFNKRILFITEPQGQVLLRSFRLQPSVHDLCPSEPAPLPKLRLMRVCMREFSQLEGIPSGTDALNDLLLRLKSCEF